MAKTKLEPPKDAKESKQSTLNGFFAKPKMGASTVPLPAPPRKPVTSTSPVSTTLRTPSSATDSSPMNGTGSRAAHSNGGGADRSREGSPLKKTVLPLNGESEDDLSPPPEISGIGMNAVASSSTAGETMDIDQIEDEEPADGSPFVPSRRRKRNIVYVEPDTDESDANGQQKQVTNGRRPRKSLKEDSDSDEFLFDDADDMALAAVAEEYEASVMSASPSYGSSSPVRKPKPLPPSGFGPSKPVPKKAVNSWSKATNPLSSRPGPKPLNQIHGEETESRRKGAGSRSADGSDSWLRTAAERKKEAAQDARRDKQTCFDFLLDANIRDKDGRRPDDPEYDGRTVFIPQSAWDAFSPFENQFWKIKKDLYNTVLFFQKGKFYELYENDATIGHREFDLKLTDRVKMRMVGVPEQSFDYWVNKFIGAGYQVGKVAQSETMIGMEMRHKAAGKPSKPARPAKWRGKASKQNEDEDETDAKIVKRELKQVFTNGTIVDPQFLSNDDANYCVSIKELRSEEDGTSVFGLCILDASTGEFRLSAFEDDICRTRLETFFRQIRPKELLHAKSNLSVQTARLLRNILSSETAWQSFKDVQEFYTAEDTLRHLGELFETEELPEAITSVLDKPLAMEALGGMVFYLKSLNLDKDLVSQRNFNIYDPMRTGHSLVLDGQTLCHMEVLVNDEGGTQGTLLELLQQCQTPFGKRLFRIWITTPLRDAQAINARLDAVDDLMDNPNFSGQFTQLAKKLPDLERIISRIHAGSVKESDFTRVVDSFYNLQSSFESLSVLTESFKSKSIPGLLATAPDLTKNIEHIRSLYTVERGEKTMAILPTRGANDTCDAADAAVERAEASLNDVLERTKRSLRTNDLHYWNSAQGGKEIFQLQVPSHIKVPENWTKQTSTKAYDRYITPETQPLIRQLQEARETQSAAKRDFFRHLLTEFDKDRDEWLTAVRVVAELDCLVSLTKASSTMDQPKCRPEFVESEQAFVDFTDLRHPSMCLRSDFIANDVQLGGVQPRTVLLTGPNMAGKSTLLRMTAAGVILAQLGCYVPAATARLAPIDRIITRMGAYDNMFASASTFKVELDETSKIIREAGPKSLVILDELGRGTSTYDGMAIAGAVLHHLATHTLPLGFFATHYGSLTDDFTYHPNIRKMHMETFVDDDQLKVVFLYRLIPGVAESSHGTHVARMAGVPNDVVARADQVSAEFFQDFKVKLASRRQSPLPLVAHADFAWLLRLAHKEVSGFERGPASAVSQLAMIKQAVGRYEGS